MADVVFSHSVDQWVKLQLAMYAASPGLFPEGESVIIARTDSSPLLVSDGYADNLWTLTDAQLTALITAGKPADDSVVLTATRSWWARTIKAVKEERDRRRSSQTSDPLDELMEGIA